jgi:hypothetical protein
VRGGDRPIGDRGQRPRQLLHQGPPCGQPVLRGAHRHLQSQGDLLLHQCQLGRILLGHHGEQPQLCRLHPASPPLQDSQQVNALLDSASNSEEVSSSGQSFRHSIFSEPSGLVNGASPINGR